MRKIILISLGFLALALGFVGVVLPIMPTTPFILVAAACFGSSSPKMYKWLSSRKYFGDFIDNYKNKTGIKNSVKIKAISFLWITLIISALIFRKPLVSAILLIVGIAVSLHIIFIKQKNK